MRSELRDILPSTTYYSQMGTAKHRNIIRIETVRAALVPFKEPDLLKLFSAFGKLAEAETLQEKRKFSSPNASVCAFGLKTRKGPSGSVRPSARPIDQVWAAATRRRAAPPHIPGATDKRASHLHEQSGVATAAKSGQKPICLAICLLNCRTVRPSVRVRLIKR